MLPLSTQRTTSSTRSSNEYVLVCADAVHLILPQQDLGESIYLECDPALTAEPGVFSMATGEGKSIPVIALSENLAPLEVFPSSRFVLTRLIGPQTLFFAWSEVRVLGRIAINSMPLPPILCPSEAPLETYTVLDKGQLAFCTSAAQLLKLPRIAQWLIGQQASHAHASVPDIALDDSYITSDTRQDFEITGVQS
jgi:hypothetical protein